MFNLCLLSSFLLALLSFLLFISLTLLRHFLLFLRLFLSFFIIACNISFSSFFFLKNFLLTPVFLHVAASSTSILMTLRISYSPCECLDHFVDYYVYEKYYWEQSNSDRRTWKSLQRLVSSSLFSHGITVVMKRAAVGFKKKKTLNYSYGFELKRERKAEYFNGIAESRHFCKPVKKYRQKFHVDIFIQGFLSQSHGRSCQD